MFFSCLFVTSATRRTSRLTAVCCCCREKKVVRHFSKKKLRKRVLKLDYFNTNYYINILYGIPNMHHNNTQTFGSNILFNPI